MCHYLTEIRIYLPFVYKSDKVRREACVRHIQLRGVTLYNLSELVKDTIPLRIWKSPSSQLILNK